VKKYFRHFDRRILSYKKYSVLQEDQFDCGVACIQTIIKWYGIAADKEVIRLMSGTTGEGTTMKGLQDGLGYLGLATEGWETDGLSSLEELNGPLILHLTSNERLYHYVVLLAKGNNYYIVADPSSGIVVLNADELSARWTSKILLTVQAPEHPISSPGAPDQSEGFFRWLANHLKGDASLVVITIFLGLLAALSALSVNIFLQRTIDFVLPAADRKRLLAALVLLSSLFVIRAVASHIKNRILNELNMQFNSKIIQGFFTKLVTLPYAFFESRRTGDFIARMNDASRIQTVISILFSQALIDGLVIISSLVILLAYGFGLFSIICAGVFVGYIVIYLFSFKIAHSQKDMMSAYAASESHFIDTITGIFTVKNHAKEALFAKTNLNTYDNFQQQIFKLGNLTATYNLITDVVFGAMMICSLAFLSFGVLAHSITVGEFVSASGLIATIIPAIVRLAMANVSVQEARISFQRMYQYSTLRFNNSSTSYVAEAINLNDIRTLAVQDLEFNFPGSDSLLCNICFTLQAGDVAGLVGPSGSGKSTLLKILHGHYPSYSGSVLLNQLNQKEIPPELWKATAGMVSQETKIFNNDLAFNVSLQPDGARYEAVRELISQLELTDVFERFRLSVYSMLGEDGIKLSGGQKQLIALLRVIYQEPKIILMDEPFTAMDTGIRKIMAGIINRIKSERIIILTSHYPEDLAVCNRMLAIDGISIVEIELKANTYSA